MSNSGNQKLYDVKAGNRLFPSLSASIIVKNIKNGKLKPHHEISGAGADKWTALEDVAELQIYFHPEKAATVQRTMAAGAVSADKRLYEIKKLNNIEKGLTVVDIAHRIRAGEFNETDHARAKGKEEWQMAGDMPVFEKYFDLRRSEVRAEGLKAYKKDYGKPFYADLAAPFQYMFTKSFFFNLLVILGVLVIPILVPIPIVSGPVSILVTFYIFAYYFRVINDAGSGGTKFPVTMDFSDFIGELLRPGVSFFLTRVFALIPLFAYLSFVKLKGLPFFAQIPVYGLVLSMPWAVLALPIPTMGEVPLSEAIQQAPIGADAAEVIGSSADIEGSITLPTGEFEFLAGDIVIWLCLIFFLLYFPISLLRQSSYGAVMPTMNIPAIFQSIFSVPGPYLALVGINLGVDFIGFVVLFLIGLVTGGAAVFSMLNSMVNPGAGQLAGALIMIFPLIARGVEVVSSFIKMYFMGRFMYQNANKMGWD